MTDDSSRRVARLIQSAAELVEGGTVRLQVESLPTLEFVYVSLEDDSVVVSDGGEAFAEIVGLCGGGNFMDWSSERAASPVAAYGVALVDESEVDASGEVVAEGWRIVRRVEPGDRLADAVQAVAHAIDGVLAVHARSEGAGDPGSFVSDHGEWEPPGDE